MKRITIVFFAVVCIAGACFISCTSENPLEPTIRGIWGDYDYLPYEIGYTWTYNVNVPRDTVSYNMSYSVASREYQEPYNAWKVNVLFEWIIIGYQYIAKENNAIYYFCFYTEEWAMFRRFPFVIGNTWNDMATVTNPDSVVYYRFEISGEVIGREHVSVKAGNYENCVVIKERQNYTALDPLYEDSSYYYDQKLWFAPNVGRVKLEVTESNLDYMVGYTESLREFKKSGSSAMGGERMENRNTVFPSAIKKLHPGFSGD
jgi:hypothetical protein